MSVSLAVFSQMVSCLVIGLIHDLLKLLKHQRAVCGCQRGSAVEVLKDCEGKNGKNLETRADKEVLYNLSLNITTTFAILNGLL